MPSPFVLALAAAGPVVTAGAWTLVRRRVVTVWVGLGTVLGVLGALALLTGRVQASEGIGASEAAGLGLLAGVVLYGATAAFMYVFRRWPLLARQARRIYDLRGGLSAGAATAVAVLVAAPGEELFWRGLVQPLVAGRTGWPEPVAAAAVWAVYLAVNAWSDSLPIGLGAVVGGASWAALAVATGGVAAPIGCHAVWTGLMIVRPPVFGAAR
jgi:uncharacterized protein